MLKLMMLNWIKLSDLYHSLNTFLPVFFFLLSLFFLPLSLSSLTPFFLFRHHYIDDVTDFCPQKKLPSDEQKSERRQKREEKKERERKRSDIERDGKKQKKREEERRKKRKMLCCNTKC